jgi:hypothetical protein
LKIALDRNVRGVLFGPTKSPSSECEVQND